MWLAAASRRRAREGLASRLHCSRQQQQQWWAVAAAAAAGGAGPRTPPLAPLADRPQAAAQHGDCETCVGCGVCMHSAACLGSVLSAACIGMLLSPAR